ncbi:hypothetical protein GCM10010421_20020 [Streptomyces glaucus]|uniref:Secreted protein n=1 Tax=Streptomyces glaucus TaxID=284029 RepID=A0ABN3JJI9_9ACTN
MDVLLSSGRGNCRSGSPHGYGTVAVVAVTGFGSAEGAVAAVAVPEGSRTGGGVADRTGGRRFTREGAGSPGSGVGCRRRLTGWAGAR